jgi:fumarylpyruvate hydrolase
MTRRDLQLASRDRARPWYLGKNFSLSAVVGAFRPRPGLAPTAGRLRLTVNGKTCRQAELADMVLSVGKASTDTKSR